jgi:hypothetical protein
MLEQAGIGIAPFDAQMAQLAFNAVRRDGKGEGRPAQLNIVDCAACAWQRLGLEFPLSTLTGHQGWAYERERSAKSGIWLKGVPRNRDEHRPIISIIGNWGCAQLGSRPQRCFSSNRQDVDLGNDWGGETGNQPTPGGICCRPMPVPHSAFTRYALGSTP